MESKLKQLKVADLKDLLNRAQVSIPARANKPDLIATIVENPAALNVYDELYGGGSARPSGANTPRPPVVEEPEAKNQATAAAMPKEQDILAPPEEFDWNAGVETSVESAAKNTAETAAARAAKLLSKKDTVSPTAAAQATPSSGAQKVSEKPSETKADVPAADEDEEAKKRRARAERFGVPFVAAPSQPQNKKTTKPAAKETATPAAEKKKNETNGNTKTKTAKMAVPIEEDPEKLKARAMRFGLVEKTKHVKPSSEGAAAVTGQKPATPPATTGQKRAAPATESTDSEEAERRRKRAERFGYPVKT